MSGDPDTKVCPKCAETIRAKARLCPHCQTSQSGIGVWKNEILVGIMAVVWVSITGLVCALVFPWAAGGHEFWLHRADLQVLDTKLAPIVSTNAFYGEYPHFLLTGHVTNSGEYAWRIEEFEVRFLDAGGKLRDVAHPFNEDDFVVQPGQVHDFRVVIHDRALTNSDIHEVVRVNTARDGNHKNWIN